MKTSLAVERLLAATMFEGYLLYPYRPSVKNQFRWTFGVVHAPEYAAAQRTSETSRTFTDCLVQPEPHCRLEAELRFLHLVERTEGREPPWQEAVEERVGLDAGTIEGRGTVQKCFQLAGGAEKNTPEERRWWPVAGELTLTWRPLSQGVYHLRVAVANSTAGGLGRSRDLALRNAMIATHTLLQVSGGRFISTSNPPVRLRQLASRCCSGGAWPVLLGLPGDSDTLLASPIVLDDHPQVADESPQDLFDSTEIDELLTLRVLALTDREKELMRRTDPRARALVERTERLLPDDFLRLHGRLRRQ